MKDAVLLELAARWERDASENIAEDGSDDARLVNAKAAGRRAGLRECADTLKTLTAMLGDAQQRSG